MNIIQIENTKMVENLFEGWQETLIWSCLDKTMGYVFAKATSQPESAMAMVGDFSFYAGKPDKDLVMFKPAQCRQDFIIMVPQNEQWADLIAECYAGRAKMVTRYAIKKEENIWDLKKLQQAIASLDNQYTIKMIDEELFNQAKETSWMHDMVSLYADYAHYKEKGLGAVILKDDIPVSGASSYSSYSKGIEIEIDTREDFRRKGLAYACGAKLILECVKRGLYPSWDAQNRWSVALAEKLGYHFDHEYTVFEVNGY